MIRFFVGLLNLIASLITIFNVFLVFPSLFKNVEFFYFLKITDKNFALKFALILLFQAGIGLTHSAILRLFMKIESYFIRNVNSLFLVIFSSWLTIFNVSEILYSNKVVEKTYQYFGMFFFLSVCYLVHFYILYIFKIGSNRNFKQLSLNDELVKPLEIDRWIVFLGIFNLMFFVVYWING